jgi:hypothetical protein
LSSLCNLASLLSFLNALDDTNGNSLSHIPNSESSKGRIIGKGLNAHGFRRNHLDNSGITRLDEFRRIFDFLARSSIDLLEELSEFASNVSSMTIEDRGISSTNLTRVIQNNDLSIERVTSFRRIVLGISANVPSTNFLDRNVLDVESNVISRETFDESFVVHFDGFDFSSHVRRGKSNDHTSLDDTGFDSTDRYCSDTADLVNVLKGKTERLIGRTYRGLNTVDGFKEGETLGGTGLAFLLPTFEPRHVDGLLNHVLKSA